MWKSPVQRNWEEAARKIGYKFNYQQEDIFVDYWDLPENTKVEDLEEEREVLHKLKFFKKRTYKKKRSGTKWTYKKSHKNTRK